MEELMTDVRTAARNLNLKPATILQYAAGLSGNTWDRWENGAGCDVKTADRIRDWISKNEKGAA